MKPQTEIKFNQYNKKGKLISSTPIDQNLFSINVEAKAVKVEIEGNVEVFEVISKK